MGLFDKFKRLKKKENTEKDIFDTIDKSDWLQVFSACLGKAMVIQNNAGKYVVKNRNWSVDFGRGYIAFGEDKYPVQLIGSESDSSNSWMWGWNNINNFPPKRIALANEMQAKGKEWSLDPLRMPQFDLDDIFNGHTLSIVACGLSKDDYFYYRGPHGGGAVFMAVGNVPREVFQPANISEFANLTVQCIQQYHVDHKIFAESLLQWNRTKYDWDGDTLIAHFSQDLYISFERSGDYYRITGINTKGIEMAINSNDQLVEMIGTTLLWEVVGDYAETHLELLKKALRPLGYIDYKDVKKITSAEILESDEFIVRAFRANEGILTVEYEMPAIIIADNDDGSISFRVTTLCTGEVEIPDVHSYNWNDIKFGSLNRPQILAYSNLVKAIRLSYTDIEADDENA